MTRLRELANSIVDEIAHELEANPDLDLDESVSDKVFEGISDTITSDADAYVVIREIDLDQSPDGDTLFRAIQQAAERVVRSHVESLIESDARFKKDEAPTL